MRSRWLTDNQPLPWLLSRRQKIGYVVAWIAIFVAVYMVSRWLDRFRLPDEQDFWQRF